MLSGLIALFTITSDVAVPEKKDGADARSIPLANCRLRFCRIENFGMKLLVDIGAATKSGYYLDQRDSRLATRAATGKSAGTELLLLYRRFCRVGVNGRLSRVVSVDASRDALDIAGKTLN